MKKALKFVLPIVAIVTGIVVSLLLFVSRPEIEHKPLNVKAPLVTVQEMQAQSQSIPVFTRGTVTPGTEIQLISEVSGQVLELSPNFANGGFFRKGEILVRVDPIEYEVNIKRAEANKAQAYQAKLQAEAEKKARSRVKNTSKSQLANYEIQYQQAKAQYDATVAELEAVKLQKARTIVRAPFDGRVRMATLNLGQFVRPGQQMGSIYAVDVAEVRLPLSDRQLSLVDVPMRFQDTLKHTLPEVTLTEEFAGRTYTWKGQVVRAEGGVDERNRLLYVVARVQNPYSADPNQPGRPELVAGSFVEATIDGRRFDHIFEVPRKALRNGAQLWVVDKQNKLREKEVAIIYKSKNHIYVSSGLENGEKVVLSQMDIAVDGMTVRTQYEEDYQFEPEPENNSNIFGNAGGVDESQQPLTVSMPDLNDPKVQALANQAKEMYKGLSEEQKVQAKSSAQGLMKQAQNLQQALAIPEPALEQPKVKSPQTHELEDTTSDVKMSPLAAELEVDIQEEEAPVASSDDNPQPVAQTPSPAEQRLETKQPSSVDGKITISTVTAPKPLVESIQ
jgi:RND family efflux transporter MFP subunit